MPVCSMVASRSTSGSSTPASSAVPPCSSMAVSRASARSSTARACSIAVSASPPSSSSSKVELAVVGAALLQLAAKVAQGQVGEVVGTLVGPDEVRRQRGVADQSVERPPPRSQGQHRALRVVQHLGRGRGRPTRRPARRRPRGSPRRRRTRRPSRPPPPGRPSGPRRCRPASSPARSRRPGRRPCGRARRASRPGHREPSRLEAMANPESSISSSDSSVSKSRSRSTRNSRPSNKVCTSCRSHGRTARSAGASSRSRSQTSALSCRLRMTSPRCARRFSPALPVIWSAWVTTLSRPSYCWSHLAAVFGPTPGTPGRLSESSPTSAASSG